MTGGRLPRPATGPELAVLHHPDRRSPWVVLAVADLATPATAAEIGERLDQLVVEVPIVGARLVRQAGRPRRGGRGPAWVPGAAPVVREVAPGPAAGAPGAPGAMAVAGLAAPELVRPFRLGDEPPVRVAVAPGGRRLLVAAHHAALDGLGVAAVVAAIAGPPAGAPPAPAAAPLRPAGTRPSGGRPGRGPARRAAVATVRRALRPADRVPADGDPPEGDVVAARAVDLRARGGLPVTARLAAAAVAAAGERARRAGAPWGLIGVSLGVGADGTAGPGNRATYLRLDLPADAPVGERVAAALAGAVAAGPAPEQRHPSPALRLLAPVAGRFSDSVLVSNLGRLDLPGVHRLAFHPVARGRSAVAVGCATVGDGPAVVTLRARDLSPASAAALLDDLVDRLG